MFKISFIIGRSKYGLTLKKRCKRFLNFFAVLGMRKKKYTENLLNFELRKNLIFKILSKVVVKNPTSKVLISEK